MASITELVSKIRNAILGKDVRESIAASIEQCYEDASKNGNANMEVTEARGTFETLNKRLNNSDNVKADKTEVESTINNLQNQVNGLASGSPLVANSIAEMTDTSRVYVNTSDGHWYTYNGTNWIDGGVYQATEIADGSINSEKLENKIQEDINKIEGLVDFKDNVSTVEKSKNRFNYRTFMYRKYINVSTGEEANYDNWGFSDYIEVEEGKKFLATCYSSVNSWGRQLYGLSRLVMYNKNKEFVQGQESFVFSTQDDSALTIPKGVKYIRFGFNYNGLNEEYVKKLQIMIYQFDGTVSDAEKEQYDDYWIKYHIKSDEIDPNLNELIKNYIEENKDTLFPVTNLEKFKQKYRYLVSTFYGSYRAGLILLGTNDLKTFDLLHKQGIYTIQKNVTDEINASLRDPAIIKIGDYFYYTYTIIGFNTGSNKIGFCRTKDFETFEELENLSLQDNSKDEFDYIWAPDWFRYKNDIYVLGTCHNSSGFSTAIAKYNPNSHTLENAATILSGTDNGIDFHMYAENGSFYLVGAGGLIYKSNYINSNFEKIETNLTTGYEADFLVKLDSGKWRLYRQQLSSGYGSAHMTYVDSLGDDLESNWGDVKQVEYTKDALDYVHSLSDNNQNVEYYHWTIYDLQEGNNNNNNFD